MKRVGSARFGLSGGRWGDAIAFCRWGAAGGASGVVGCGVGCGLGCGLGPRCVVAGRVEPRATHWREGSLLWAIDGVEEGEDCAFSRH